MFLINLQGKESIYEQIRNQIIKFIDTGILKQNDKLPSCRVLAQELGINPNTVNKAYSELEKNGYIYTVSKKGVFVCQSVKTQNNMKKKDIIKVCQKLKADGFEYEELIDVLKEVYKN